MWSFKSFSDFLLRGETQPAILQTCFLANFPHFFKVFIGKLSSSAAGWLPSSSLHSQLQEQDLPEKELSLTAKKLLLSQKQYIWLFEQPTLWPWFSRPVEHNYSILMYICLARFWFPAFILPASYQKYLVPIFSQLVGLSSRSSQNWSFTVREKSHQSCLPVPLCHGTYPSETDMAWLLLLWAGG